MSFIQSAGALRFAKKSPLSQLSARQPRFGALIISQPEGFAAMGYPPYDFTLINSTRYYDLNAVVEDGQVIGHSDRVAALSRSLDEFALERDHYYRGELKCVIQDEYDQWRPEERPEHRDYFKRSAEESLNRFKAKQHVYPDGTQKFSIGELYDFQREHERWEGLRAEDLEDDLDEGGID